MSLVLFKGPRDIKVLSTQKQQQQQRFNLPPKMNDEAVSAEMAKMISFIKMEALEKAREVKIKADEEFNIEKAKLVRAEGLALDTLYEKKIKAAKVGVKIAQSNYINKSRLRVLATRQAILGELFAETRSKLNQVASNPTSYAEMVKNLLLQGFFKLMENQVAVQCKASDVALVQKAIGIASAEYSAAFKGAYTVQATIDQIHPLPPTSAGGVILTAMGDRIRIDNSLEARLIQLQDSMLPDIRIMLFGPSPTRRFYN